MGHIGLDGRASMLPWPLGRSRSIMSYNAQAWLTFGTSLGLWMMQPATWNMEWLPTLPLSGLLCAPSRVVLVTVTVTGCFVTVLQT